MRKQTYTAAPEYSDRPFELGDASGCAALREAFHRAGYLRANLQRLFGAFDQTGVPIAEAAVCLRRFRDDSPLATLARLFQLQAKVPEAAARAALAPLDLARVQSMGLIDVTDGEASSRFTAVPFEGFWLVSDPFLGHQAARPTNCVTGVNPTSVLLAQITIRRPVQTALDMGTGNGVHALLASRHATRVLATDINPRALNVTAFNALLNGVSNIECRQGSFFAAVGGETFDHICTNPPFVISPETRYLYRDAGMPGDAICADLLSRLPDFLNEGGIGHMLANWVCTPYGDWAEAPRHWLGNRGCDVLLLLHQFDDPLTYAARWLGRDWPTHSIEYGQAIDRWLSHYGTRGIEAIASGGVVIRKRSVGVKWFQAFSVGAEMHGDCGQQLDQLMNIQDYYATYLHTDDQILDCRFKMREHLLEQTHRFERGRYQIHSCSLRLPENMPLPSTIDAFGFQFLSSCDGLRTLREVLRDVATRHDVNCDEFASSALPSIRDLITRGYLVPVELSSR